MIFAAPPGTLVDRVIAVVDKEVITHSELLREARIALVLRSGEEAAAADLPDEFLNDYLEKALVDQLVIAAQARRLGGIDVSEDEVDRMVERFSQKFRSLAAYQAFLRRFDISTSALRDVLRRDIRASRHIEQRMSNWRTGREAEQLTEEYKEQYAEALMRWVAELKMGVELRVLSENGELELRRLGRPGDLSGG
ncbi:MAG: hypothetical protein A2289_26770 [Deltaproteobacteria bacterium RIFOXYA12_FULL_58_15]|nr:MAG: hypothetical protein A2289_26770 [Deltaproteobacteria bacterium RIFOXYA12_FULL_58_15]OGR08269.1 MAG: hypothetical protein A2341_20170 [Deltaproteobacteria bacterium RIFOXYB12_FULL_58_9]